MTAETANPLEGTPLIKPSSTDHPLYDAGRRGLPFGL